MTSFLLTSDITRGETYLFKLRAKNIHGWSAWSDQSSIKAAGKPYQSPACTTENNDLTTTITLRWFEPDYNSESITSYEVEIQDQRGAFVAASDCTDLFALQCTFETLTLTKEPFSLPFGSLVVIRARTTNAYGTSTDWSPLNESGATIKQVPLQMGPISVLSKTETEISLSWSTLESVQATGDTPITGYNLYWDNAQGNTPSHKLVTTLSHQFIVIGTQGGNTYSFAVTASNVFGEGPMSDVLV